MELNYDNIIGFWQWFVKNEKLIKDCIENEHSTDREFIVEQMNEYILSFGVLTWDMGLNDDNNWFLMLSPNGDKDMLKVSQHIMIEAPEHMDWLFYASRPAKHWNRQFSVYDEYMDEQFIDASDWHYLFFENEDGKLALVVEAKNVAHLDIEIVETAGEQFVIHEIGELAWMTHIASVEIVPNLESEHEDEKTSVRELKAHLEDILNEQN